MSQADKVAFENVFEFRISLHLGHAAGPGDHLLPLRSV